MATISLNECAYDLLEYLRITIKDNDFGDIRQIKYWVNATRAKLLKQRFDKMEGMVTLDEHFVQNLSYSNTGTPLIELEYVDSSFYNSIPSDRYMVRTKVDLPATIERDGQIGTFTRIGPVDRLNERYKLVSQETAIIAGSGKFNQSTVFAFLQGPRICLVSKSSHILAGLKYLDVRGIFQNPVEAALFTNSNYTDDDDYPINLSMIDDMKSILLNQGIKFTARNPIDPIIPEQDVLEKRTP